MQKTHNNQFHKNLNTVLLMDVTFAYSPHYLLCYFIFIVFLIFVFSLVALCHIILSTITLV